jgi:hypothetical protein
MYHSNINALAAIQDGHGNDMIGGTHAVAINTNTEHRAKQRVHYGG